MSKIITKEDYRKLDELAINALLTENETVVISEKITFKKGIYWCNFRKNLFTISHEKDICLDLTTTQSKIIEYLIENKNNIVSANEIIKKVWTNKRDVSIFTLRNMIKQIRDKSYYQIIESVSGRGYSLGGIK